MSPNVAYHAVSFCVTSFVSCRLPVLAGCFHTAQLERCKNDLRGNEKWASTTLQKQDRPFFHLCFLGIWLMDSPRVTYRVWASSALKDTRWAKTHLINDTYLPTVSVKRHTKHFLFDSIGKCFKCKFVNTLLGNWTVVLDFTQTEYNEPLTWTITAARCSQLQGQESWLAAPVITGAVREMTGHMFDTSNRWVHQISHVLSVSSWETPTCMHTAAVTLDTSVNLFCADGGVACRLCFLKHEVKYDHEAGDLV